MENRKIYKENFLLARGITVGHASEWIKQRDKKAKEGLIRLIKNRFQDRYISHIKKIDSGFLKMAISCLTIEALESFRQGKKDTKNQSPRMFNDFFSREKEFFDGFDEISTDFYKDIRCGILHQAETTNGWRILRKGSLLDKKNKIINATKFVKKLEKSLNGYMGDLEENDFDTQLWKNTLAKIATICKNCDVTKH